MMRNITLNCKSFVCNQQNSFLAEQSLSVLQTITFSFGFDQKKCEQLHGFCFGQLKTNQISIYPAKKITNSLLAETYLKKVSCLLTLPSQSINFSFSLWLIPDEKRATLEKHGFADLLLCSRQSISRHH